MPVISDGEFVRACQLEISRRYEHGPWSDMDYTAWFASYNFGDISEWPLDAVVVSSEPREKCLLGSLRTAADLLHAEYVTGVPITVVLSVCWKAEMQVKGTPKDWNQHFLLSDVQHLQVELDDYQVKYGQNPDWFMECAENCIRTWKAMADALLTARIACREAGRALPLLWWHQSQPCGSLRLVGAGQAVQRGRRRGTRVRSSAGSGIVETPRLRALGFVPSPGLSLVWTVACLL